MIPYFMVALTLWVLFFFSLAMRRENFLLDILALFLFVCFSGLRFKTGNDWLVYEQSYEAVLNYGAFATVTEFSFEPLYLLLTSVSVLFLSFQFFLFLVALFNGLVVFHFCRFFRVSFSGVAAICFSWIYLGTYMAALRYSLAISFVLLGVVFWQKRAVFKAFCFVIVAIGFHLFSLIFLPILFISKLKISWQRALILLVGIVIFGGLFELLFDSGLFSWVPFYEKVNSYIEASNYNKISFGALFYIVINLTLLFVLFRVREEMPALNLAKWSTMILLAFQIGIWFLPVFWNRFQVFAVIVQSVCISGLVVRKGMILESVLGMFLSLAIFARFLMDPAFVSYIPYQNVLSVEVFGAKDEGGERRFYEALDIHTKRNVR